MNTTELKNSIFTLRSMIFTAIMAAIICVCAPFSIPVPGLLVPISLATFAVYLAGGVLGAKRGALAVLVYILIGAVGLPVFSGFSGGLAKLFGVTGGYIIGYIPCALLSGLIFERVKKAWALPLGMAAGTAACYIFGTAWFLVSTTLAAGRPLTGAAVAAAVMNCVVPFLVGDAIKIAAATSVTLPLKSELDRIINGSGKKAQ